MRLSILTLISLLALNCKKPNWQTNTEAHAESISSMIINQKNVLQNSKECKGKKCIFLSFWDLDGTILKGDCSNGYKTEGNTVYKGLVQLSVEKGYSKKYKKNEYEKLSGEYKAMKKNKGSAIANSYLAQIYAGTKRQLIHDLSENYFTSTLSHHYFESSMKMMKLLKSNEVVPVIISASPDIFVRAIAPTLDLGEDHFRGIRTKIKKGIITDEIVEPITYAEGKTENLKELVKYFKKKHRADQVFVLAGFGNSYHTDGHFLNHIAQIRNGSQPALSVMINGGSPQKNIYKQYAKNFRKVTQARIVQ